VLLHELGHPGQARPELTAAVAGMTRLLGRAGHPLTTMIRAGRDRPGA
jgi:hypothetical protein